MNSDRFEFISTNCCMRKFENSQRLEINFLIDATRPKLCKVRAWRVYVSHTKDNFRHSLSCSLKNFFLFIFHGIFISAPSRICDSHGKSSSLLILINISAALCNIAFDEISEREYGVENCLEILHLIHFNVGEFTMK